jgi:hypothetical protein
MIGLIVIFTIISFVEPLALNVTGKSLLINSYFFLIESMKFRSTTMLWNMFCIRLSSWTMLFTIWIVINFKIYLSLCIFYVISCGATPEHCQGAITQGSCQTKGCPNGLCCSKYGFCGNTPAHCDNTPITNGNCKTQGCPPGQCCSLHGL